MNVRDIRTELAKALANQGFRPYSTIPAKGQLPLAAVSWPDEITYHTTLGDNADLRITVTVAVSMNDLDEAQAAIDDAMSTPGFVTALEQFRSPAWHDLIVETSGNVRQVDVGAKALAADFRTRLIT